MIGELAGAGFPAKICCLTAWCEQPGYYKYRHRPLSPTRMQWLTGLIREVHTASRGTYGSRRIHAELTRGMDVRVTGHLVAELMHLAGIAGLPGPAKVKRLRGIATKDDLVHRKFHRLSPNELWVTDITEHPSRGGKAVPLRNQGPAFQPDRRVLDGRADESVPGRCCPGPRRGPQEPAGTVVHSDRGSQFRSRKFVLALNTYGLSGSMGRVGACGDNAAMESFFSLPQKNVLNRKRWDTRAELRLAIATWIERSYHRKRRQRALGRLTPIEFETIKNAVPAA